MSKSSVSADTLSVVGCAVVLTLCQALVVSSQSCLFPSEIQTDVADQPWKRDWRGEVRDQFTKFTFKIVVDGGDLRLTPTEPQHGPAQFTRHCVRVVLGDRYLVTEEDADRNRRGYTCLRFLIRSAEIVQIWSAELSSAMDPELCSDVSLRPDKWLTVDHARLGVTRVPCPLEGGFTIRVFDKMRQRGICDAWEGETRLESECNADDGLTFLFRTQSCVPEDMYMYASQPTHCLATWNDGHYTFTVLRHNLFNYTWLMRFPGAQSDSFTAYLFKDLIADSADIITDTFNYLRLDTTRDAVRSPGDLCYDDYERCTIMRPPCSDGNQPSKGALACPLKCGLCRATSPQLCRLRLDWIGKWDAEGGTNNRSNSVTINSTTMTLHSHHHSQNLRCVEWQADENRDYNSNTSDSIMFVTEFANGCRPRYTCARIQNLSGSMLNLTLSKTVSWPFIQNPGDRLDCSALAFKPRTPHEVNRTRHFLLHSRASQHPVSCSLPFRSSNAQIRFINGTTCNGRLAEARGHKAVELSLRSCSASNVMANHTFLCLESSRFSTDNDLIITMRMNLSNTAELYCLVFPTAVETTFHLLSGAEICQQAIRRETSLDRLNLLRGTLSGTTYRSTTSRATTAEETTPVETSSRVDSSTVDTDTWGPSESVSKSSRRSGDVPPPTSATSSGRASTSEGVSRVVDAATTPIIEPVPTPLATEHPFVVGVAALLFGIIQGVIYICKCF